MISNINLNLFLQPTKYCDCNSPNIKNIAYKITYSCKSEEEKAKVLFNWVKENIKFEFGYWGVKASEVLKRKGGMCTNKANLLITLLRAVKIPAGYGILNVKTKEFWQELMCPFFKKLVAPQTVHIYVGIFLNGKWLRCDPTADSEIVRILKKQNPFAGITGFNITETEIKKIKGILKRSEFFGNIDKNLDKPPKHAKGITLKILNSYLQFLREGRVMIENLSDSEIEKIFFEWLSKKNTNYFNFIQNILS